MEINLFKSFFPFEETRELQRALLFRNGVLQIFLGILTPGGPSFVYMHWYPNSRISKSEK